MGFTSQCDVSTAFCGNFSFCGYYVKNHHHIFFTKHDFYQKKIILVL